MKSTHFLLLFILILGLSVHGCNTRSIPVNVPIPLNSRQILEDPIALDSFIELKSQACDIELLPISQEFNFMDTLYPKISFVFVKPDSSYQHSVTSEGMIKRLQKDFKQANIKPVFHSEETFIDEDVLTYYANYTSFVRALSSPEAFYVIVFPKGVKFRREISNGKRVSIIHGSAITIISEAGFIREEVAESAILTHELAHYWGLRHIFQKDGEDIDFGLSCTTGDLISDTPYVVDDAKFIYKEDGTCELFTLDTIYPDQFKKIVVHNFTSYSHDKCMNSFTENQIRTMRKNLLEYKQLFEKLGNESLLIDYKQYLYTD